MKNMTTFSCSSNVSEGITTAQVFSGDSNAPFPFHCTVTIYNYAASADVTVESVPVPAHHLYHGREWAWTPVPRIPKEGWRVCMLEAMHRIIIYIDDELDIRAQREARRRNISRAALIRQSLVTELGPTTRQDLLDELIGLSDAEPVNDLDSIVYGA